MRYHVILQSLAVAASALQLSVLTGVEPQSSEIESVTKHIRVEGRFANSETLHSKRQEAEHGLSLRLLPYGASIMTGQGSSDGAGLRKYLRESLRFEGFEVDMVGSFTSGKMTDNDHDAVGGDTIEKLGERVEKAVSYKPNVVIMNVGTNDALGNVDVQKADARLRKVLDDIWNAEDMNTACVILSTLIPLRDQDGDNARKVINEKYRTLIKDLYDQDRCIFLADMDPAEGDGEGWISVDEDMDKDGIHPNDNGHKKMASIFFNAIMRARDRIVSIEGHDDTSPTTGKCDKKFGDGTSAGGLTQTGGGEDDGIYQHEATPLEVTLTLQSDEDRDQWRLARLFSRDYDDLLEWFESSPGEHRYRVWKNSADGKGAFTAIEELNPNLYCKPAGVRFIDMTGDGLDDLVCITDEGTAYLSVNQGDGSKDKPPSFKRISKNSDIKEGEAPQARIRLADIDGDGRGDYLVIDDNGDVRAWRNAGTGQVPESWQSLGVVFTVEDASDIEGVRFEDINGDGRDDWNWVDEVGAVTTWTNSRSCETGKISDGLHPIWRRGQHAGEGKGPTHLGMAKLIKDEESIRQRILFGRVIGKPQGLGLLGRQDYVYMEHEELQDGKHQYNVRIWENQGRGSTKTKADGNRYCNMMGHEDGKMDFVWIWSTGKMVLYPNAGKKDVDDGSSFWNTAIDPIWSPPDDLDRKHLHLTDYDGDGTCDIVYTDPDNKNRIGGVWINKYPSTGKWEWDSLGIPPEASDVQCSYNSGIGFQDTAVRFADITGNKQGDYLCVEPNGRVTAFTHEKDNWNWLDQIKFGEGLDRANFRWADVNGDGKADLIWVDKFDGNARVWYNEGTGPKSENSGSAMHWRKVEDPGFDGKVAGSCSYYPDLDGNGRADMHTVSDPFKNEAETWFSPDCGPEGDTSEDVADPKLPIQPGAPSLEPVEAGKDDGGRADPKDNVDKGGAGDDNAKDAPNANDKDQDHNEDKVPSTGNGDVFIDPSVWEAGKLQSNDSAVVVLPPIILPEPSAVTIPPYTTSFEIGGQMTTVTVTVEPLTITSVPMANVFLGSGVENSSVIQPIPSIDLSPVAVPVGSTTTNVTLPPWPWITMGPPESWTKNPEPPQAEEQTTLPDDHAEETKVTESGTIPLSTAEGASTGPPDVESTAASTTDSDIPIIPVLRGTKVPPPKDVPTTAPPPVETSPDPPPDIRTDVHWDWHEYPVHIEPVDETDDEKKKNDDNENVLLFPCNVWFFNFCPEVNGIKIKFWRASFPPGFIGPGPPPPGVIKYPPGFRGEDPPIPWPKIRNPPGPGPKKPDFPDPPDDCEPRTAAICSTLTSYSVEPGASTTKTVTSDVSEQCQTVTGCYVKDYDEESTTEDGSCTISAEARKRNVLARGLPHSIAAARSKDRSPTFATRLKASPSYTTVQSTSATSTSSLRSSDFSQELPKDTFDGVARDHQDDEQNQHTSPHDSEGFFDKSSSHTHSKRIDTPDQWANDYWYFENGCGRADFIIIPEFFALTPNILDRLNLIRARGIDLRWEHIASKKGSTAGFTAYFYVYSLPVQLAWEFALMLEVGVVRNRAKSVEFFKGMFPDWSQIDNIVPPGSVQLSKKWIRTGSQVSGNLNATLAKRYEYINGNYVPVSDWALSMVSAYPGIPDWASDRLYGVGDGPERRWIHRYDTSNEDGLGAGQLVYLVDSCVEEKHPEFARTEATNLFPALPGTDFLASEAVGEHVGPAWDKTCRHGTQVLSRIVGKTLGHAPAASVVTINSKTSVDPQKPSLPEAVLEALILVLDDLHSRGPAAKGKAVVNISIKVTLFSPKYVNMMAAIWARITSEYDAVLVTSSNNDATRGSTSNMGVPSALKLWPESKSIIVVGAANIAAKRAVFSEIFAAGYPSDLVTYAPGSRVEVATPGGHNVWNHGTSLAAPIVAGIIAYWRALPGPFQDRLKDPAQVAEALTKFSRPLTIDYDALAAAGHGDEKAGPGLYPVPVIWNGQYSFFIQEDGQTKAVEGSCFMPDELPPGICPEGWYGWLVAAPGGSDAGDQGSMDGNDGIGNQPPARNMWPTPITWTKGEPSPTCAPGSKDGECGTRCNGDDCMSRPGQAPVTTEPAKKEDDDGEENAKQAEEEKKKKEEDKKKKEEEEEAKKVKACKLCRDELGATFCPVNDSWQSCVWNQCAKLQECQTCGLDCEKEVRGMANPNDERDPKGEQCNKCNENMKATKCEAKDFKICVKDQCIKDESCNRCNMDCQRLANGLEPPKEAPKKCEKKKGGLGNLLGGLDDVFDCINDIESAKGDPNKDKPKEEAPKKEEPKKEPKEEPSHAWEPVDGGKGSTIMRRLWNRLSG